MSGDVAARTRAPVTHLAVQLDVAGHTRGEQCVDQGQVTDKLEAAVVKHDRNASPALTGASTPLGCGMDAGNHLVRLVHEYVIGVGGSAVVLGFLHFATG